MGFAGEIRLLLWKNYILRKRQPARLIAEICLPLCLFFILVIVKSQAGLKTRKPECHYKPSGMPSAGVVPFLQSYICNLDVKCYSSLNDTKDGMDVGNSFDDSIVSQLFNDVEKVLSSNTETEEISRLLGDASVLTEFWNEVRSSTDSLGSIDLSELLTDADNFRSSINNQDAGLTSRAVDTLLNASIDIGKIIRNPDFTKLTEFMEIVDAVLQLSRGESIDDVRLTELKEYACDDELLLEVLEFSDEADALELQEEICKMTVEEVEELLTDLAAEFNASKAVQEVRDAVQNATGRSINLDFSTVGRFLQIIGDIQGLPSLDFLFKDVGKIADESTGGRTDSFNYFNDPMVFLSKAICGRDEPLFDVSEEQESFYLYKYSRAPDDKVEKKRREAKRLREQQHLAPRCADLIADLKSNTVTNFLWKEFQPIILGVINYTPDTPLVRSIIQEASRVVNGVGNLIGLVLELDATMPDLQRFFEEDIEPLREFLNSSLCKEVIRVGKDYLSSNAQDLPEQVEELLDLVEESLCNRASDFIAREAMIDTVNWNQAFDNLQRLLNSTVPLLECVKMDKFVGYKTEEELNADSKEQLKNGTLLAALVFHDIDETTVHLPNVVKYSIRMDSDRVDGTKSLWPRVWKFDNVAEAGWDTKYFTYGFIYLQDMIDHAIIRLQTGQEQEPGIYTQRFPYPCWTDDTFMENIANSIPLFMILSWVFTVAMAIKGIVHEKEIRLKEVMKMMGLSNGVHWLAWFVSIWVVMLITILLFCFIAKVGQILQYTDASVVFVIMLGFSLSTISMCFLISVLFNKANLAAVCGGFLYFILYMPYVMMAQWATEVTYAQKLIACFSSNIAMGYSCMYLSKYEGQAEGAHWSNIGTSPMINDEFSLRACILMMYLDTVIYLLFTWYIEAVFPGQYGIPRKWYFFVQKSYWMGSATASGLGARNDQEMSSGTAQAVGENFEAVPAGLKVGVAVKNLRKVYSKGQKVAVDGLTINFFEDQITSFLGHNGAGKTTTMSVLTGLFPPTSGSVTIYGLDILTDMDAIRRNMGICPQHNLLFDLLTVEEHIWFYAKLKGCSDVEVRKEMEQMIQDVGLPKKREELSQNLSGGMKRKLSVAIAFVGGSRTVILDEPTAGVDPHARRSIWELLLKYRKGRTIILTTHHMDEADVLGDRIAIISQGKLCTAGSSLFLKNRFGNGYYLTLVRQDQPHGESHANKEEVTSPHSEKQVLDAKNAQSRPFIVQGMTSPDDVELGITSESKSDEDNKNRDSNGSLPPLTKSDHNILNSTCSRPQLMSFVSSFVSGAEVVEDNQMEICFRLPEGDNHEDMQALFSALEASHRSLGVSSYGISDTTLEEVFLKVAEDHMPADAEEHTRNRLEEMSEHGRYPRPVSRLSFRSKAKRQVSKLTRRSRPADRQILTDSMEDNESRLSDSAVSEIDFANFDANFSGAGEAKVTGHALVSQQIKALFIKRFLHVKRNKKGFVSEILLPAAFVCLAMIFSVIVPPFKNNPKLELQPWMLEPSQQDTSLHTFYSNHRPEDQQAQAIAQGLIHHPFFGTRCMNPSAYTISGKPCENVQDTWSAVKPPTGQPRPCSCSSGFQKCTADEKGPEPSMRKLPTHDKMHNMTGRDISQWLVKTMMDYRKRRYGGFSVGEVNSIARLNGDEIVAQVDELVRAANGNTSLFTGSEKMWTEAEEFLKYAFVRDNAKVWYNKQAYPSPVSYMNALNNVLLRVALPKGKVPEDYGIVTYNHPMNFTKGQLSNELINKSTIELAVALCVIFALSLVPASFVLFLIQERASSSKHLQIVSGINPVIYWLANSLWDLINYIIPTVLCIFIFLAFQKDAFVSAKHFPCLVALLLLYGWAVTPMMYPFSRFFNVPSSAFVALACINIFFGTITTLSTFVLQLYARYNLNLKASSDILKQIFLVVPQYCLGRGLLDMTTYQMMSDASEQYDQPLEYSLFEWNILGRNLFCLFVAGVVFIILNILMEYKFFCSWKFLAHKAPVRKVIHDRDVERERQRILSGAAQNDILRLEGISKVYWSPGQKGKMTAVDHLYVGVPRGQCFGLLGVNGAGKTTTFKMLTGDIDISEGDAFINGLSVTTDMDEVRQMLGYCPQFDALDPLLTGREHLEFYARVRGISSSEVKSVADWGLKLLGLSPYADKISGSYSGGNKRKLSTAIALIGKPPIIFLDEPTTGMDPQSRRFLWNCVNQVVKSGRSVILTSHSMEECEALCSRLAIMVNGSFQCLGSIQHLKNRFGNGYTITLRVTGQNPELKPVIQYIKSAFPSASLSERHHNMLQFHLGTDGLELSAMFQVMEQSKRSHGVEDYSISQTTLDQVFITFAKMQTDMKDEENEEMEEMGGRFPHSVSGVSSSDAASAVVQTEWDQRSVTGSTFELVRTASGRNLASGHGIDFNNGELSNSSLA